MISLALVAHQDHEDLLQFEQENCAFFESHVTARSAGYDSGPGLAATIEKALREADEDLGYQYLIRDVQSQLIGRINLSRVRRAHFHSAELGYRIAQRACGQRGFCASAAALRLCAVRPLPPEHGTGPVWHDRLFFERHRDLPS